MGLLTYRAQKSNSCEISSPPSGQASSADPLDDQGAIFFITKLSGSALTGVVCVLDSRRLGGRALIVAFYLSFGSAALI